MMDKKCKVCNKCGACEYGKEMEKPVTKKTKSSRGKKSQEGIFTDKDMNLSD